MIPGTWITEFLKELKVLKQIVKLIMMAHVNWKKEKIREQFQAEFFFISLFTQHKRLMSLLK